MRLLLLGLVAAFALSVEPAAGQANSGATAVPVLRSGDAVRVSVWRKPEISGEYDIGPNGSIADPFYMGVSIAGLTAAAATDRVRAHVARFESDPQVLLVPLFRVAVGGEVRQPNLYSFGEDITVGQAIMIAGGPTDNGRLDRVRVLRDGRDIRMNLLQSDGANTDMPIQSGDRILVSRRVSVIRDYVAPGSSIIAAAFTIANAFRRW